MNIQGNDELREMLAAEYALGTLRGGARRRFERWLRNDDALRALAFEWSERLLPLIDSVPPEVPSKRVWDAIEARLPGFTARRAPNDAVAWWDRLGFWRGLTAAFAAVAVVTLGLALRPLPVVERTIVRVEPRVVPAEPKTVDVLPTAVALLVDKKGGTPVAVVMEADEGRALIVQVAAGTTVAEGQALQLWMVADDSPGLKSLGVLARPVDGQPIHVTTADATALAHAKAFGLSLEPAGGSPQPTKVLGLGALVRLKG